MVRNSPSRAWPVWRAVLAALFGGLVAGTVAKLADGTGIPAVGMIGTLFGAWIMLVALIAAWSRTWSRAVLCAVTFLLAMVTAYYVFQMLLFGFFSAQLFLAWIAIGLVLAPPFAALAWQARGVGWLAALGAAVPIGLLLYEAYSLRFRLHVNEDYKVQFVFDIVCAVVLVLFLSRNGAQRLRVLALTIVIVLGAKIVLEYALPVVAGIGWG